MNILKPRFWQKKSNIFSILLWPISLIFLILSIIKKNISSSKSFDIPIICVGNIYIGGTGKTPLSIFIINEIKKTKKPVIIKKYYKEHRDEHELINERNAPLILDKNRSKAIIEAKKKGFNVIVLDDGFQDHSIKKNLNIICFNNRQLIGNGMLFPAGPLREKISSLKNAQIVVLNGKKNEAFENLILGISKKIQIYHSKYIPLNIDKFKNKKLIAFAGIGSPNNFFEILRTNSLNLQETLAFPDHYKFTQKDLETIVNRAEKNNCEIITTEKDYHRIKNYNFKSIKYLELKLEILNKDQFIKQIFNFL